MILMHYSTVASNYHKELSSPCVFIVHCCGVLSGFAFWLHLRIR